MPIFEYICQECQHEFETLVFGRDKAKCPKCQSQKLSPQLSVFAVSAKVPLAPRVPQAHAAPAAILAVPAHARSEISIKASSAHLTAGNQTFGIALRVTEVTFVSPPGPPTMP